MRSPGLHLLDVAAVAWVVLCVLLGTQVADRVRGLTAVPEAVTAVGGDVEAAGEALASVDVPLVGRALDRAGAEVRQAGANARRRGAAAQKNVERAAKLLGFAVAVIPIAPLAFFYAPLRAGAWRERQALRRLARRAQDDPQLERLLAHRALMTMPYRDLVAVSARPWAELAAGRYTRLATAEAARAGAGTTER